MNTQTSGGGEEIQRRLGACYHDPPASLARALCQELDLNQLRGDAVVQGLTLVHISA